MRSYILSVSDTDLPSVLLIYRQRFPELTHFYICGENKMLVNELTIIIILEIGERLKKLHVRV